MYAFVLFVLFPEDTRIASHIDVIVIMVVYHCHVINNNGAATFRSLSRHAGH